MNKKIISYVLVALVSIIFYQTILSTRDYVNSKKVGDVLAENMEDEFVNDDPNKPNFEYQIINSPTTAVFCGKEYTADKTVFIKGNIRHRNILEEMSQMVDTNYQTEFCDYFIKNYPDGFITTNFSESNIRNDYIHYLGFFIFTKGLVLTTTLYDYEATFQKPIGASYAY